MPNFEKSPTPFLTCPPAITLGVLSLIGTLSPAAPPELQSLQESYNKKVAEVAAPATKTFVSNLAKIASSQAARGDYQSAAITKSKATATLAFLESLKISANSTLLLPLAEASNIGPVSYDADSGTLGRFTKENARASWEIRQITPGTYDVTLTYSVNHKDREERLRKQGNFEQEYAGGTFQVREDTKLQRSGNEVNSITHEVSSTGGWDTYRTEMIGSITLASASATIVLEALAPEPQGLMQLRELRLTAQASHPKEQPSTSQTAKKLASLKRDHETRSASIIASHTDAYSAELTSIKNAAAAAGDTETAQRATNALLRLGRAPATSSIPSSSPKITLAAVDDLKVQLAGTTTPNASRSYLTQLGPGGEGAITWQLPSERPDTRFYKASIRQRPSPSSGGRLSLTAGENKIFHYLARPAKNQSDSSDFEDTILGTLEIRSNASAIQLRIESLDPDADTIADLESLTLQPLDDSLAAKNAINLQDRNYKNYLERNGKGWEIIKAATYLPSDTARANAFQIKTASGETRKITLYGITSPPPSFSEDELDLNELESARIQLKLDQSDLERIGRKALKHVEERFASGGCTIYTDGETKAEHSFAIVTTSDGIPLSITLASEGLAADGFRYGNKDLPKEIHPDLRPKTYERWINDTIKRAKRSQKGLWEKTQ